MMKAVVIREPGGPEVLELRNVPEPTVGTGQVRVAVRVAGCNRADLLQRAGRYAAPLGVPNDIPGLEYAGDVVEIGDSVRALKVGDRVHGIVGGGAYAEQVVVHEREAVLIGANVSYERAGAVPEAFITAYDALTARGQVRPGEKVLVHAAGSGVGTAAVQLAHAMGCIVIGTSRTESKLQRAKPLGLTHGIVSHKEKGFADEVLGATDGQGADVVIDLVGGDTLPETLRAAAVGARIVCVGLTAGAQAQLDLGLLLRKRLQLVGTTLRSRPLEEKILAAQMLANPIAPWVARGIVTPIIERVLPLAQAPEAHRLLASDTAFGKVLLTV